MTLSNTLFTNLANKLKLDVSLLKEEKNYLKNLSDSIFSLKVSNEKNYKLNWKNNYNSVVEQDYVITYIITISFLKANTIIHVSDVKGNVKLFYSSGSVGLSGKQKIRRRSVILRLISMLSKKTDFLANKPIALHLNNVNSYRTFIVNKLKRNFYIKIIKSFNQSPYNGCRKKKIRRKKYSKSFK